MHLPEDCCQKLDSYCPVARLLGCATGGDGYQHCCLAAAPSRYAASSVLPSLNPSNVELTSSGTQPDRPSTSSDSKKAASYAPA